MMKGKTASLAWGAVHPGLMPTGEDRVKAAVDWRWAGLAHERTRVIARPRAAGPRSKAPSR